MISPWPWTNHIIRFKAKLLRDAIDRVVSARVLARDNEVGAYEDYEPAVLDLVDVILGLIERSER